MRTSGSHKETNVGIPKNRQSVLDAAGLAKDEPWPETRLKVETQWADVSVFLRVQIEKRENTG